MCQHLILDTDTGVDDALAICLALRSSELCVQAITAVHGNVPVEKAVSNILRTLRILELPVYPRVAMGAARPLVRPPIHADEVHGEDGLGGATRLRDSHGDLLYPELEIPLDSRPAPQLMCELIARYPKQITLVAVGPLTNLGLAIQADPASMRQLREIVVMGGTFRRQGNASPVAEYNIYTDPHAAQLVFDLDVPVTIIPLDATEQVTLTRGLITHYATQRLGRFIRDITAHTMHFGETIEQTNGCYIHDALAVAYLLAPDAFRLIERYVAVETEGKISTGQTIADLREPPRFMKPANARIALDVDAKRILNMFEARVLASM